MCAPWATKARFVQRSSLYRSDFCTTASSGCMLSMVYVMVCEVLSTNLKINQARLNRDKQPF